MRMPVTIALAIGVLAATPALAHEAVLGAPDPHAPAVCPQLPTTPVVTGAQAQPGAFPGPTQNERMARFELGSFDLARELPDLPGRTLRARFWAMEPGGVIGEHCHEDRPAYVYLLQGQVEETTWADDGTHVRRIIRAGEAVPERNGTRHWWVNHGPETVLMVAMDIPRTQSRPPADLPDERGVSERELSSMMLREQYPHVPGVANYMIRGRLVTIAPGGSTEVEYYNGQPGIAYVIVGPVRELRADRSGHVDRMQGEVSMLTNGLWNQWQNVSHAPAMLLIVEFVDCGLCNAQ